MDGGPGFYNRALPDLLRSIAAFNPHAEVRLDGKLMLTPAPLKKWNGCDRTSAHWYTEQQLADLIAAHVHRERQGLCRPRSVRDFITNFHKLSGSSKAPLALAAAGLKGKMLADLTGADGGLDMEAVRRLLAAMRAAADAPKPAKLGVIGKARMAEVLVRLDGADPDHVRYHRACGVDGEGRPFVVEAGFAVCKDHDRHLSLRWGVNWSPSLSPHSYAREMLDDAEVDDFDPVALVVHVVTPRAAYTDAGKSQARLSDAANRAARAAVEKVTAPWTRMKNRMAREDRVQKKDLERLSRKPKGPTIRDAAFAVMAEAHAHVIEGRAGAPAHARQIMYAARQLIKRIPGARCWKRSNQFTQGLLPDYLEAHPDETAGWNVVFDARGVLSEPHRGLTVGLGTLQVREYLAGLVDGRPLDRYRHVLLIEKEGFRDLFEYAGIADRFDVALAWTKGLSTTAARELVDGLSGLGVTALVLHDLDVSGLSLAHTIRTSSRRYRFKNKPLVEDIGLRLGDVRALGLEGEEVDYPRRKKDPREPLVERGVPEEERNYLVRERVAARLYRGRRIELNELSNDQLITFVERKLIAHGVKKVVPDEAVLRTVFDGVWRTAWVADRLEKARRRAEKEAAKLAPPAPRRMAREVRRRITGTANDWRQAVQVLVSESRTEGKEAPKNRN